MKFTLLKNEGNRSLTYVGANVVTRTEMVGKFGLFIADVIKNIFKKPVRTNLILQQIEFIGQQSTGIVVMSAFFTGAVFGLQLGGIFRIFNVEAMIGGASGKALTRELAPLMVAFLTAGRSGSAMTAEISTMKVNEQIEAMEAMAVDPINYLVVPRVIAAAIVMPLLTIMYVFVGIIGSFIVASGLFGVDIGLFVDKIKWLVVFDDIFAGISKAFIFSFIISIVACRTGLMASGGAKGVGLATTNAVVTILLTLLLCDFIITYLQFRW